MTGVWAQLLRVMDREGRAALVTVVMADGSTPREAGARMVVGPQGDFSGTIGGGTLEWRAIALAQGALARPDSEPFSRRSFALGPELGQCCGGRVELAIELFGAAEKDEVAALAEREAAAPFATEGRVGEDGRLRRLIVAGAGVPGNGVPGTAAWQDGVLRESFGDDRRPLLLFGAGHVGRALVLALAPLPFAVTWVDPRPEAFPSLVPAGVRCVQPDQPAEMLRSAAPGAFVLIMTHSHALDLELAHSALAAGQFPYVGVIGSATKRARFARQLRSAGLAEARIAELVCPIGVGGIQSKLPAAIAAATAAELLQCDEAVRAGDRRPEAEPARRRIGGSA